jgi:bacteriorhodopsin
MPTQTNMDFYQAASGRITLVLAIVVAISCGVFAAVVAGSKNRSRWNWFMAGLVFNIVALIAIAGMPPLQSQAEQTDNRRKLKHREYWATH